MGHTYILTEKFFFFRRNGDNIVPNQHNIKAQVPPDTSPTLMEKMNDTVRDKALLCLPYFLNVG